MSERDVRVEAMLAAWPRHSFIADGQAPDEIGPAQTARREALLRPLLSAADAVQGQCTCAPTTGTDYEPHDPSCPMSRQRADDRRMVDLDAVMEGNRNVARNIAKRLYRVGFPEAAAEVESLLHEFGGSANQPADDRRMVDLDLLAEALQRRYGGSIGEDASNFVREFGGSAPSEDQP